MRHTMHVLRRSGCSLTTCTCMWLQRPLASPFVIETREWRCQFCLSDCLDLTRCLSILLWISACQQAGPCDFAFVGAVEISSLRLRTVGDGVGWRAKIIIDR